jgi:hypothetical protein
MKKRILLCLLSGITFIFSGCFETTEELTIAGNGSGTYHVSMDMGGLFDLMDMMKGMDTTAKMEQDMGRQKFDTTINLRSIADTASQLTAEQKALLRNAVMKMVMNMEKKEFKMDMDFPFTKVEDVEKLMKLSKSEGSGKMLGGMMFPSEAIEGKSENMPDFTSFYDMKVQPHLIERKLNDERYNALKEDGQIKNIKEAGDALSSIKMNTVIHLPQAAKKVEGSKITLSGDKKTITLKGTLADMLENPTSFSYRIEY